MSASNPGPFYLNLPLTETIRSVDLKYLLIKPGALLKINRAGIVNVGQFHDFPPARLFDLEGIGSRTMTAVIEEVKKLHEQGTLPRYHFENGEISSDPAVIAKWLLSKLDKEEREVMIFRFGLGIDRKHTLKAIGEIKEITRERVRQRESKNLLFLYRIFGEYLANYIENMRRIPPTIPLVRDEQRERNLSLLFSIVDIGE